MHSLFFALSILAACLEQILCFLLIFSGRLPTAGMGLRSQQPRPISLLCRSYLHSSWKLSAHWKQHSQLAACLQQIFLSVSFFGQSCFQFFESEYVLLLFAKPMLAIP